MLENNIKISFIQVFEKIPNRKINKELNFLNINELTIYG